MDGEQWWREMFRAQQREKTSSDSTKDQVEGIKLTAWKINTLEHSLDTKVAKNEWKVAVSMSLGMCGSIIEQDTFDWWRLSLNAFRNVCHSDKETKYFYDRNALGVAQK